MFVCECVMYSLISDSLTSGEIAISMVAKLYLNPSLQTKTRARTLLAIKNVPYPVNLHTAHKM